MGYLTSAGFGLLIQNTSELYVSRSPNALIVLLSQLKSVQVNWIEYHLDSIEIGR